MGRVEVRMQPAPHPSPPRLEAGDRLTRVEFERRYALVHDRKAELVDGVVYMPSPARADHGRFQALLAGWAAVYQGATPPVEVLTDATVRLDEDNEPQPDVMLRLSTEHGGRSLVDPDGYVSGPPELTIEVAASSSSYDLHQKKEVYRRSGCQEYMVVLVHEGEVRWFGLDSGRYEALTADDDGLLRSGVFPGLWLDPRALLERDMGRVLRALRQGLSSPEHGPCSFGGGSPSGPCSLRRGFRRSRASTGRAPPARGLRRACRSSGTRSR